MRSILLVLMLFLYSCGAPSDEELLKQYQNPDSSKQIIVDPVREPSLPPTNESYVFDIDASVSVRHKHQFSYFKDLSKSNFEACKVFVNFKDQSIEVQEVQTSANFTTTVVFDLKTPWSLAFSPETGNKILSTTGTNTNVTVDIVVFLNKEEDISKVQVASRVYYKAKPKMPATNTVKPKQYGNANEYFVRPGDHANSIAADHKLTLEQFLKLNPRIKKRKNYVVYPNELVNIY
jgi:hypothetical protein